MIVFDKPAPWLKRRDGQLWFRDFEPERKRIRDALKACHVDPEITDRFLAFVNKLFERLRVERDSKEWSVYCDGGSLDYDERMETVRGLQHMVCELTLRLRAIEDQEPCQCCGGRTSA